APVEVAVHEVGRADVPVRQAAVLEAPDPRVLEERTDDRSDRDVLGDPLEPWQQGAAGPTDDLDPDAVLRSAVERVDRLLVDDRVHLQHDPSVVPTRGVADLPVDELEEARPEAVRRDEQPPEVTLAGQAGQDVEEVGDIRAEL